MITKKDKAILFIPGIGRSEKMHKNCSTMGEYLGYDYRVVEWQRDIESISDPLMEKHTTYGAKSAKVLRKVLYEYGNDAVGYRDEEVKEKILTRVMDDYLELAKNYREVILITHSWGTVIGYDFIRERFNIGKPVEISKFVTLASPLPFAKNDRYDKIEGIQWINLWEKSDGVAHQLFRDGIKDIEVKLGLKGLWLFSHVGYLKSKRCCKLIKRELGI